MLKSISFIFQYVRYVLNFEHLHIYGQMPFQTSYPSNPASRIHATASASA